MKRPQCHVACPSPLLNVKSHKWASASKWTMNVQHLFVACILYSYSAAEGQFAMVIFWHGGQILRWAVWGFRAWEDGSVRPILRFENLRDRAHGAQDDIWLRNHLDNAMPYEMVQGHCHSSCRIGWRRSGAADLQFNWTASSSAYLVSRARIHSGKKLPWPSHCHCW